ncbi:MAG: MaoC family dehydratase [Chloroflexi bacterium]|nr:MaoC family dehydratase [Chloroflexota bacterium]
MQQGKTYQELNIGDRASLKKQITESDVFQFAAVSGDNNPLHLDEEYASRTRFQGRIAHGMLSASLISALIGTVLPGSGNIYVSQTLNFRAPVWFGDVIEAEVEVVEKMERFRVRLRTVCRNQDGVTVIDGEAIVLPPH